MAMVGGLYGTEERAMRAVFPIFLRGIGHAVDRLMTDASDQILGELRELTCFHRTHPISKNEAHICYVCIISVRRGQLCLRRQPAQRWWRRVSSSADIIVSIHCSQHGWIRWRRRRHGQEGWKEGRQKVRQRWQCPSQAQGKGSVG